MSLRAPVLRAREAVVCARARLLTVDGEVIVRIGDTVQPDDVIAEASIAGEPVVVNVARELDYEGDITRFLVRHAGYPIKKGEVLAARKGLWAFGGRTCVSPIDGVVGSGPSVSGEMIINPLPTQIQLKAGMPGVVAEIIPNRGVVIQVEAASVQGVASTGPEVMGHLRMAASWDSEIHPDSLDESCKGAILVGGAIGGSALARAQALGVRGVVVGGVVGDAFLFLQLLMQPEPMSLLVTDGFGADAMDREAYEILASLTGRLAVVLPSTKYGWSGVSRQGRGGEASNAGRKVLVGDQPAEVIVPLERTRKLLPSFELALTEGARVRLRGGSLSGRTGTVVAQAAGRRRLPSGVVARTLEVKLEDGTIAQVPGCNLELIG